MQGQVTVCLLTSPLPQASVLPQGLPADRQTVQADSSSEDGAMEELGAARAQLPHVPMKLGDLIASEADARYSGAPVPIIWPVMQPAVPAAPTRGHGPLLTVRSDNSSERAGRILLTSSCPG